MVSSANHGISQNNTIGYTIKKQCLGVPAVAGKFQTQTQKSPHLRGLQGCLVLLYASHCQTRDHSHSIVAGGLLDTSYVTRLIPRTSLMMREDTFFNNA
ncbi:hypothetical protein CADE109221_12740 [Castellaniella denitrificans]